MNFWQKFGWLSIPITVAILAGGFTYLAVNDDLPLISSSDDPPDLGAIRVEPGRVSCEMFQVARGYRYQTVVTVDLKDRPPGMEPDQNDTYRDTGIKEVQDIVGDVEGVENIYANVIYTEEPQVHQQFIAIGDKMYRNYEMQGWTLQGEDQSSFQIPYVPGAACNAIAPDIFLSGVQGTPEEVRGIKTMKYHFDELTTDFPDRHPTFGPGSDVARFVNDFSGDIWVAEEGGYIAKMDLVGIGQYTNGRGLELQYAYELYDVNAKIEITTPLVG